MKQSEILNTIKREWVVLQVTMNSLKKHIDMLEAQEVPVVNVKDSIKDAKVIIPPIVESSGNDFDKDTTTVVEVPIETYNKIAEDIMSFDEEVILGCKLLMAFDIKYNGKASYITLHLKTFNNGKKVAYLDRYHVACDVYDEDGKLLGSKYIHKDCLVGFPELLKKGLYTWDKNFKPKSISFMV